MSEETAGQGASAPTSNTDAGQSDELKQALQTIERLRGTQSSNDRELSRLRAREAELNQRLIDIEAARAAAATDLQNQRALVETLNSRLSELGGVELQAKAALAQAEKMRLAAVMAGTTPAISLLVEANALPQVDAVEDFKAALERIASGIGQVAIDQARGMLQGTHPNVPGSKPTRESMLEQAEKLIQEGKFDEGIKLHTEALNFKE